MSNLCPCNSQLFYSDCCEPYHLEQKNAPTAEALMRSRYSAFVKHNANYLIKTWHPSCRVASLHDELTSGFPNTQWLGLNIISSQAGTNKNEAYVEFSACFIERNADDKQYLHERSRFLKIDDCWFYIDGVKPKVGRNDPCPCGSGRKYKKCCENNIK
ncbi:preprotein translocase subunit SecA [Proteus vulgaris]|uniref:YchJ family protein n=1 Tax=Proteus vulgaris TaxID=585 RepID=UPI000E028C4E|nr:YchJ family protein [Proteus vulgaris]SUC01262.1 preprotein translocase subunit SecA [Proteus vulgaris]